MIHARLALVAVVLGSLAMTGCQSVGTVANTGMISHNAMPAQNQTVHNGAAQQSETFDVQQVGYNQPISGGGCGCASCATNSQSHSSCGCNSCGNGCNQRGGLLNALHRGGGSAGGHNVCQCGRFSFSIFGSSKCGRCGQLRGAQCGHCGSFGIFGGRCHGCGQGASSAFGAGPAGGYCGPQGPTTGTYAYPYYTIRGPRDFFTSNPPSLGR